MPVVCPNCQRSFTADRYLRSHLKYEKNKECYEAYYNLEAPTAEVATVAATAATAARTTTTETTRPPSPVRSPSPDFPLPEDSPSPAKTPRHNMGDSPSSMSSGKFGRISPVKTRAHMRNLAKESTSFNFPHGDVTAGDPESEDSEIDETDSQNTQNDDEEDNEMANDAPEPDKSMMDQFEAYCTASDKNFLELSPSQKAAISLLSMLSKKRLPLVVYKEVFKWHLAHLHADEYIAQEKLMNQLKNRYNMENNQPKILKQLRLPHSGSRIDLVIQDAKYQIQSLLSDPRIHDEDYLFFDDDPLSPPPDDFDYIGDINTGRCYRETYKELITNPENQVLLPMIFYMDSAVTGNIDALPIEALKMTLGIYNQKTRDKAYANKPVGFITRFIHEKTQAEDLLLQSGHMDAHQYVKKSVIAGNTLNFEDADDELAELEVEEEEIAATSSCAGQDLHFMMGKILEPYKQLEESGRFWWNFHYKGENRLLHFVPFVMFVKGDSVELDKHCGSYTIRTRNVAQLCRYCTCPMEKTDEPWLRYPRKSKEMINSLVLAGDLEELQQLSQQCISNTWYKLQFGCHNSLGIHGATPLDLLHYLNINKFKYNRGGLFDQLGENTALSRKINALMVSVGCLFSRQSDRNKPRTSFSKGLKKGRLQGHEMSGLMLVIVAVLRTKAGRVAIRTESRKKQREHLDDNGVKAWVDLLELHLMWEAWLKSDEMEVSDVMKSEEKVREIMDMEKKVWKRTEGMGMHTFNFHATVHLAEDILDFGVPNGLNTSSNEMHHRPDKTAAQRTQKRPATFDWQSSNQIHNMAIVEMALVEVLEERHVWEYFERKADNPRVITQQDDEDDEDSSDEEEDEDDMPVTSASLGGTRMAFKEFQQDDGSYCLKYRVLSKSKAKSRIDYCEDLLSAIKSVYDNIKGDTDELLICTEYKRNGHIFRSHPSYTMIDHGRTG